MKTMEAPHTHCINPVQTQAIDERFENIEKGLADINNSIKSSNRSWAEVAQQAAQRSTPNITRQPTPQEIKGKCQKHDAELKRERAKLEIILTMENATDTKRKS